MYIPPKFALTHDEVRLALHRGGFAQLVTYSGGDVRVTPLPLVYDAPRHSLLGHVARANPHWRAAGGATVAIFTGPQAYISPSFYATKAETGRVVPTWNYDVLAVHGELVAHDDTDWLRDLVTRLTEHHERDRADRWQVSDAPESYIEGQLKGIVGIELRIRSVEGKSKMSQNQPGRNRDGVVTGLRASAEPGDHAVAERVESLGNTNANGRG
ncbi:FMN-binding negative transcriptional regulator [Mycolicibacterium iranicum]|uniref:Transcriptional regulator n=1 Tax=Mycolicibacterium iranicum TaxID=912594 RepID=A0A178LSN1_MYCIR|nr:FMN-binding negative transcriptional regulator [Mycolicibacterium iranicum]OAN37001.1 transcriptional regulator [Mycolicibacterium iranicum]